MPRAKQTKSPPAPATPFVFGCELSVFPANEVKALERFGARFEALSSGAARPATAEERHFLRVDREEAEPTTVAERAWLRLKARREFEREQKAPPPAQETPETYGMVEFDHDRCWW